MCEEALCNSLNIDNVSDVFALADLHSAEQLKMHAIDFINRYKLTSSSSRLFINVEHTNGFTSILNRNFFWGLG